ncbi:Plasmid replication protein [Faecalicoccus pleomorphus]|uniref:Plasmid replication protein n=1 Tax=Faecalicoccus pleomorphus TaxID=1323 RepID=A0A380LH74_9FIRM|nr:Plasmid replication protein [Faecalicoccus pleomorphus]
MRCNTYPSKTYYADYTMSLNDEKVQLYGEFAKIDPFEFWDLDSIDNKLSKHLSKLKKRHWMYIVYPESAPKDWMQQLEATGVKFAVSPLHDKDKLVDGKYKKKHWHLILIFDGPTTFMTAASYIGITNGPYPKVCESLRGLYENHSNILLTRTIPKRHSIPQMISKSSTVSRSISQQKMYRRSRRNCVT